MKNPGRFRLKVASVSVIVVLVSLVLQALLFAAAGPLSSGVVDFGRLFLHIISQLFVFSLPIVLVFAFLLFLSLNPLYRAVKQISKDEIVPEALLSSANHSLLLFQRRIILGNLFVYLVGTIVGVVASGHVVQMRSLIEVLYSLASAFVAAFLQVAIDNLLLTEQRALLGIYTMDPDMKKREPGLLFRTTAIGLSLVAYVLLTFLQVGASFQQNEHAYAAALQSVAAKKATVQQAEDSLYTYYQETYAVPVSRSAIRLTTPPSRGDSTSILLLFSLCLFGIALLVHYLSGRSHAAQLANLREKLDGIVNGSDKLTQKIEITHFDEIGEITGLINQHSDSLRLLVDDLAMASLLVDHSSDAVGKVISATTSGVEKLISAANQVADMAQSNMQTVQSSGNELSSALQSLDTIADNVSLQASFVEQTSSAVNEFAASIESVTRATSQANELATNLIDVARDGAISVSSSVEAIQQVETSSREVTAIVGVISKIAAQTNLLAMNAAIEAAHAGDAGRGFAVVAEEVRNLAEHSSVSAKEITSHLKGMAERVENGVRRSQATGLALTRISDDINQTTALVSEISAAMQEQNAGTKEILDSINSLVNATAQIRTVVTEQKEKNETLRKALESVLESFREIENASRNQTQSTTDIANELQQLRSVSVDNRRVVKELEALLSRYRGHGRPDDTSASHSEQPPSVAV